MTSPSLKVVPDSWRTVMSADPRRLAGVRSDVHERLAAWGYDEPVAQAAVLSVHELVANAAEHAYRGRDPGPVVVELRRDDGHVTATVADSGRWRVRPTDADDGRGRGLVLVRALMSDVDVRSDDRGTVVRFRVPTPELAR
jgi:anti-sigma regulatory factor (Ser/Thr protein kinase)